MLSFYLSQRSQGSGESSLLRGRTGLGREFPVARADHMVYNPRIVRIIRSSPIMLERIRQNLTFEPQEASIPENLTPAAVLFPLLLKDNNLHVLFTKRTQTLLSRWGSRSP